MSFELNGLTLPSISFRGLVRFEHGSADQEADFAPTIYSFDSNAKIESNMAILVK